MLNRVVLIGRLTRDPEGKYTPAGVAVTTMGIAVQRFTKDESGDYEVDFFNIVAFRRTAEFASQYLTKGRLVSVDGRLTTRTWVGNDGQKRTTFEIIADNLEGLDKRGDQAAAETGAPIETHAAVASHTPRPVAARATVPAGDDIDESDPFADE